MVYWCFVDDEKAVMSGFFNARAPVIHTFSTAYRLRCRAAPPFTPPGPRPQL